MPDREKVIKGLEVCFDSSKECNGCTYIATPYCKTTLRNDVTALLKEQEPVKPKSKARHGENAQYQHFCGNCMAMLFSKPKFCPNCGRGVKWE